MFVVDASVVTVAGICNSFGGGFFLTCHCGGGASGGGEYQSGVKARVVNSKQVDVTASRSFWLSWNALIAHGVRW